MRFPWIGIIKREKPPYSGEELGTDPAKLYMNQDSFLGLQHWYQSHCNGDWEHCCGIHIGTIDNPGWSVTVDLQDTELADTVFQEINITRSKNDWIFCAVKENKFEARCGVKNLPETLQCFCDWVREH